MAEDNTAPAELDIEGILNISSGGTGFYITLDGQLINVINGIVIEIA